ncbi:MFS transporter [Pseudonocardia kujensis]|uniref:MFS transporter n=1 Tax=Pseudonocardia kujensis TaxID=1128675 RepID=UPI001E308054|nr:MFS transporter [Pseudonocardia kujensis]MCE0762987.1 MFS transporter [Pseudonocardia kujensis]
MTFVVTMIGTTLPTPLYPLYEQRYGFGGLVVTVVFATYAVGVAAALVVLGNLSDRIGRRPVLLAGLASALVSSLVFLIPAEPALFVGRFLSGISAGVFTGTATATIIDLAREDRKARAGLVAAAVNMLGLGLGPVLAGILAEYAPLPLDLSYLVHAALVVVAAVALWFVPETVEQRGSFRIEPLKVGGVPPEVRGVFVRAAVGGFAGFAVLGLFTAVSPSVLVQVLGRSSHLVVGLVVFLMLGASALGQVLSGSVPERVALPAGCGGLAVGAALIGTGIATASLAVFCTGAAVAGLGQGMSFRAGLGAVGSRAPQAVRGAVVATFFLVLYVAISLPVIGVGAAAQVFGLVPAGVVFSGIVALLALAAVVLTVRASRRTA